MNLAPFLSFEASTSSLQGSSFTPRTGGHCWVKREGDGYRQTVANFRAGGLLDLWETSYTRGGEDTRKACCATRSLGLCYVVSVS